MGIIQTGLPELSKPARPPESILLNWSIFRLFADRGNIFSGLQEVSSSQVGGRPLSSSSTVSNFSASPQSLRRSSRQTWRHSVCCEQNSVPTSAIVHLSLSLWCNSLSPLSSPDILLTCCSPGDWAGVVQLSASAATSPPPPSSTDRLPPSLPPPYLLISHCHIAVS